MKKVNLKVIEIILAVLLTTGVMAGEAEEALIEQVITAYGGDPLTSMTSLRVKDKYKVITKDGGVRPGQDSISRLHSTLVVDFDQNRKSVRNWSVTQNGKRLTQIMFDGKDGWSVNFLRGSHVLRPDLNGTNVGIGMMRLLDTTVAFQLAQYANTSEYEGDVSYLARPHAKLSFEGLGGSRATLFIDQGTGLISKMVRANGTEYLYSGHRQKDGITYAFDTDVQNSGSTSMVTLSRKIDVNFDVTDSFSIPKNTKKLAGMQDAREMIVNAVGQDTYVVGKGVSASMFVDAGAYFIGAGGLAGIKERLAALNNHLGADKPLKYQILPEHQGHLSGVDDIADLGANFITVPEHLGPLKKRLKKQLSDDRFSLVTEKLSLADGKVEIYEIETLRSEQYLLFYVPAAKAIFTVDEFGTQLLNSVPSPNKNMISFRRAIEGLGLDVNIIAYTHGTSVLTIDDLRRVTDSYQEGHCPAGFDICAE